MQRIQSIRIAAAALLLGAGTVACDSLPSGAESDRQSRVILSSATSASLSQNVAMSLTAGDVSAVDAGKGGNGKAKGGQGNGPIDLSTVDRIEVQITGISVAVSAADAATDDSEDGSGWVDLSLVYDAETTWFDLTDIAGIELATVPVELDGPIDAIRLYFGDARVIFNDGTEESLRIPSGKVTLPASNVTVNEGTDVVIRFDPSASVRKVIRTGNGLLMPPVFRVDNGRDSGASDDSEDSDDGSDDSDDGSDDGDDGASDGSGDDSDGDDGSDDGASDGSGDDSDGDDGSSDDNGGDTSTT